MGLKIFATLPQIILCLCSDDFFLALLFLPGDPSLLDSIHHGGRAIVDLQLA